MSESIQQAAQRVSQAQQKAAGMQAEQYKLPDMLRQVLTEKLTSSPLYGQREQAAQQVITSPTRSRESLAQLVQAGAAGEPGGAILSPTQQQAVLAARRAADVVPLMSLNDLIAAQTGGIEGLIGAGTRAFQSQLAAAQGDIGAQQTLLDAAIKQAQLEENQRQFDLELELAKQKAASGGGGGGGIGDILSILSLLQGDGAGMGELGEEPMFSPVTGPGTTVVNDEGVVWEFTNQGWQPIGRQ